MVKGFERSGKDEGVGFRKKEYFFFKIIGLEIVFFFL